GFPGKKVVGFNGNRATNRSSNIFISPEPALAFSKRAVARPLRDCSGDPLADQIFKCSSLQARAITSLRTDTFRVTKSCTFLQSEYSCLGPSYLGTRHSSLFHPE